MTTLYNDDCINILKSLKSNSIDLIVTDPPYDIPRISGGGSLNVMSKLNTSLKDLQKNTDITKSYNIQEIGKELLRVCKDFNAYFWCNKKQIPEYIDFYVLQNDCLFDIICWHKTNALPSYSNKYLSDTEYLLYFHKGKGKTKPECYEDAKTFYIAPINIKDKKLYGHPTIKPLDLTEKIIRNSSSENDVVLDCFMGSGTTGVACLNNKRNFIGIEIDERYFEIAKGRIEEREYQMEHEFDNCLFSKEEMGA